MEKVWERMVSKQIREKTYTVQEIGKWVMENNLVGSVCGKYLARDVRDGRGDAGT